MSHNPQAFARPHSSAQGLWAEAQPGMTLRDYFAGQCLSALIARHRADVAWDLIAPTAYRLAEEMLKEREKSS